MNVLMGQEEVNPPVSTKVLLDANELIGAMRLVAEEYWLSFQLRWAEQLDQKKSALLQGMKGIEGGVGERRGCRSSERIEGGGGGC